ncbi:MAG: ice-binding family protein [Candidatus Zambryskibacteria bacterium]|nr:ice-binding family protein [Candidatus Zambryskibacteria bacterium]
MNQIKSLKSLVGFLVLSLLAVVSVVAMPSLANAATAPDLGAAANFVVLSHAGITNIPTSIITGNIGTDGVGSSITGFSVPTNCPEVTGTVYAIDATGPVCATIDATLLGTAMTDMQNAYTTANGQGPGVDTFLNPGAGEIGSLSLAPGVYTFTGVSINVLISTDLTLNGNATDVWIFQIPGTFNVAPNIKVTLTGGAVPANVFWVVAGATTLHEGSTLEGNILDHTSIAMQSGAKLYGRALAATESITLSANTISATPPTPTACTGTVGTSIFVSTNGSDSNNDGSETCPFATIQAAIDDANTISGDTINVAAGTYDIASTIVVNKALTISGPVSGVVKLQGTNASAVSIFEITASDVTIQNLEITHNALPVFVSAGWLELPNSLIRIPSGTGLTGIAITNNTIYVPTQSGAMSTWNGVGIWV